MNLKTLITTGLSLGLVFSLQTAQAQTTPTYIQLILDASGSMYSKLPDGSSRITVAKTVLSNFISQLPADPNLNVGLRIYGAGLSGAEGCQDSSLVLPMNGLERNTLQMQVAQTKPKGVTPIAYSLEQAAQDFPQDNSKKLIVLVTDGQESCRGNLAKTLEVFKARGITVDLRIVGIDLDENAKKSFQGIGTFENARSSAELAAALGRTIAQVAKPSATKLPVEVLLTSSGKTVTGAKVSFKNSVDGTTIDFASSSARYTANLGAGNYSATVQTTESGTQVFAGLNVAVGNPNKFSFEVGKVNEVKLEFSPNPPIQGGKVLVNFSGAPAGDANWITIVQKTDVDSAYLDWQYAKTPSGTLELNVPEQEIEYQIRYALVNPDGSSRIVGRSIPFTPKRIAAALEAPSQATALATLEVRWTGPNNPSDYVTIVKKGASEGSYTDYFYTRDGNPGKLHLPVEPGEYELRYSSDSSSRTLASRPLLIKAAAVGTYDLQAPLEALEGSQIQVQWKGPNNPGDYITAVPKDAPVGTYIHYFYTRDGNPGLLTLPLGAGDYELRYSTEAASPNPTLFSKTIRLTKASYSLEAPSQALAGSDIQIKWTGPNNSGDYITVVEKGAPVGTYTQYFYTRDANPGVLTMPFNTGQYELRYSSEGTSPNPTLFSKTIQVTVASYTLEAPRTGKAGTPIQIKWGGPNGSGEYVTIVKKGTPVGTYTEYFYTHDGNPGHLTLPLEKGEYEIRYSTEKLSPNPTLFSIPILVN